MTDKTAAEQLAEDGMNAAKASLDVNLFEEELRKIAQTNPTMQSLLSYKASGRVTGEVWNRLAILTLARQNKVVLDQVLRLAGNAPMPSIIIPAKETKQ